MPREEKQQSISQYIDDSSFVVSGKKKYVNELVCMLKVFSATSSMEINWEKLYAYLLKKYMYKSE